MRQTDKLRLYQLFRKCLSGESFIEQVVIDRPTGERPGPLNRPGLCERIDREVFLHFWNSGNFLKMAFVRVLYRDAYPHWPEMTKVEENDA